jgi:hypothetical protein
MVKEEEDSKIDSLVDNFKKQNENKSREAEKEKQALLKKIEGTFDENERKRLMD